VNGRPSFRRTACLVGAEHSYRRKRSGGAALGRLMVRSSGTRVREIRTHRLNGDLLPAGRSPGASVDS
jgi:hypothetical protein